VERFIAAVKGGKEEEVVAISDPRSAIPSQIKDVRELKELDKLRVVSLVANEKEALATTSSVGQGSLLIYLRQRDGNWLVYDIDAEFPDQAQARREAFFQKYPDAQPVALTAPATQPTTRPAGK
jgi:hypothetical protein